MVTLYELIKSHSGGQGEEMMWNSIDLISKFIDEHLDEGDKKNLITRVFGLMSKGHYNEEFADEEIAHMYYQDKGGRKHFAPYWSHDQMEDIYEVMKSQIPDYNLYDFIVTFNMLASDNWYLLHNWFPEINSEQLAKRITDLTVTWLNDEDWPTKSKIWDYFNK